MAADHYLPLFVGDFLASTGTMNGIEAGVYSLLLMHEWATGPLPKDPVKLAHLCRIDGRSFKVLWRAVSHKFVELDGKLINERLEAERAKNMQIQKDRSEAGRIGGLASAASKRQAIVEQPSSNRQPSIPIRSDSLKSPSNLVLSSARANGLESDFERFKAVYPRGSYTDSAWLGGERAFSLRIDEGIPAAELITAAQAYAEQQKARDAIGTQFVKVPSNFLQRNFWKGPFPLPETKAERATNSEGAQIYQRLIDSRGKDPPRDARLQAAIDSVGGWLAIWEASGFEAKRIKGEFCVAWESSA